MNPNIYPSPSFTFFKMQPIFFHLYFHFFLPLDFFFFWSKSQASHYSNHKYFVFNKMQSNLEQLLWDPREVAPTFLAPGTGFVEDQGVGDCLG